MSKTYLDKKSFSYRSFNGTLVEAKYCDFTCPIFVERPKGISDSQFAADVAEAFTSHAILFHPELSTFNGYSYLDIRVRAHDAD